MTQILKKSWIAIALFIILACCMVTVKKPHVDKAKSERTIIVDRLVNTLVCEAPGFMTKGEKGKNGSSRFRELWAMRSFTIG